jgi:FkbM family methyltransferase
VIEDLHNQYEAPSYALEINNQRMQAAVMSHSETLIFKLHFSGVEIHYSIEDAYSKAWFLPRYAGGKLHEPALTKLLGEHLKSSACFADVGAHLGYYTCLAAKLNTKCRVYGFEMDALNYELLERNLRLNGCSNAQVACVAVTDKAGIERYQRLWHGPYSGLKLSAKSWSSNVGEIISINSTSLDRFFEAHDCVPDVIKVDVEGAETLVLDGMKDLIAKRRPLLFIEVHPVELLSLGSCVREFLAVLGQAEYHVFEVSDDAGPASCVRPIEWHDLSLRCCTLVAYP